MLKTYASGLTFKTATVVCKRDIITLCNLLNEEKAFSDLCTFKPEGVMEGGILYNFKANNVRWYKTIRFTHFPKTVKWYSIADLESWSVSEDIIMEKNVKVKTLLKSFTGAPLFTIDELKIIEKCFAQINMFVIEKYPTAKSLSC